MEPETVLVVDDDPKILFAFRQVLKKEGFRSLVARDGEEALKKISEKMPDLIFMDITMPRLDGLEVLKKVKEIRESAPVVIITGYGTMKTAVRAVQLGAFEYLTKPLDLAKIRDVTRRAFAVTRGSIASSERPVCLKADIVDRYELVGKSTRMQEIYKLIGSISTTPNHTSVLIVGESGTGKELVARAVHANSANASEPFVAINCTVLPETLLESELFGYEKGAFTGAGQRKLGKFEVAGHGTIFLDEVGNLSESFQQKLLRVLQEREFERLGGNDPIPVNARFIAATNRDIGRDVKKGKFREDLFFRLNVAKVLLPPLRERKEDIVLLANYFLQKYGGRLKKPVKGFSEGAVEVLQSNSYAGNVRELENIVERAVMLTKAEVILPEALGDIGSSESWLQGLPPTHSTRFHESRAHVIKTFERNFLTELLARHRGNVTAAAKASRMTRQNFQRLMAKHKIRAEGFRR